MTNHPCCRISISKIVGGNGDERIRIEIEDDSGIRVAAVEMSLQAFASAVTGRSLVECDPLLRRARWAL